jgi:hypothetical protein
MLARRPTGQACVDCTTRMNESERPGPLWLTTEQIRKRVRCRRKKVIDAQDAGQLVYEQRGRIRYSPLWAVEKWEQTLVEPRSDCTQVRIRADLLHLI